MKLINAISSFVSVTVVCAVMLIVNGVYEIAVLLEAAWQHRTSDVIVGESRNITKVNLLK